MIWLIESISAHFETLLQLRWDGISALRRIAVTQISFTIFHISQKLFDGLNRKSERIPRSLPSGA